MKNKKIVILTLLFILSSCTEVEKRLASLVEDIPTNLQHVETIEIFSSLEVSDLEKVKVYTDSVDSFLSMLKVVLKKRDVTSRVKKYLLKQGDISQMCSKYFLSDEIYRDINRKCRLAYFDVCPITLSRYQENKNFIINQLMDILGEEKFSETNCSRYVSKGERKWTLS